MFAAGVDVDDDGEMVVEHDLDDAVEFGHEVGFFVGVSSWILWTLSAWAIPAIQTAYFLAGLAISVSTLWIVVAALRKGGAYREQYIWIATNAAFVMLLWAAYRRNTLQADGVTWGVLGAAVLLVIADIVFSKSVPELEH